MLPLGPGKPERPLPPGVPGSPLPANSDGNEGEGKPGGPGYPLSPAEEIPLKCSDSYFIIAVFIQLFVIICND